MQGNDHIALAHFLLTQSDNKMLHHHKAAFIMGSIAPDTNPISYLRGVLRCKALHGHNAENTEELIRKSLRDIQTRGLSSSFDYFRLGIVIHYMADAFTYTHNSAFSGSLIAHMKYEQKLNQVFLKTLADAPYEIDEGISGSAFYAFWREHNAYAAEDKSLEKDCRYIFLTCSNIFLRLLAPKHVSLLSQKRLLYENSYSHRAV